MDKSIVVLTNKFPFQNGETFLETEMPILASHYKHVYIFSFSSATQARRTVPQNVFVHSIRINQNPFLKIRALLLILFSRKFRRRFQASSFNELVSFGLAVIAKKRIKRIIDSECHEQITLIYSYWFNFIATAAILLSEQVSSDVRIKTLSRVHGVDLYAYRQKNGIVPCQKFNISNVDYVSAISHDGYVYLKKQYPEFSNKIALNKLGTRFFGYNPETNEEILNIATCSSLNKIKRIDLLISAISLIKNNLNVHYYCIGDGSELELLKKQANQLKVVDNITFLGRLSNSEVLNFYSNTHIDLFINVSSTEGLPVSIMEAMSFGIPCIATDVGGTSEIVNSNNGYLVSKDITPQGLANLLLSVHKKDLDDKRRKSHETWENEFKAETNYERWCDFLMGL